LRIAEEHALHEQQGEHKHPFQALPSRSRSTAIQRSILPLGYSRRRLARAESLKHAHYLAQADASFFLSLPPKVQRSAFSREEQTILVGRCDLSTPSTGSPLPPSRRPRLHHDEEQRFSAFHFGFNHDHDASANEHDNDNDGPAVQRGRSQRRRSLRP
jgi:hypothetical protein